ncbi:conjugal transfer protein TraB [Streptomyces sp. NPDC059096]|uniref:conjugal transfer protein TraB n=1 Tax=Streptomyces sp. NPDC059096 TaxID=3346727 RepID=UPI0036A29FAB
MSDLVPYKAPPVPVKGGRLGFLSLAGKMATLAAAALALKEGLWVLKRRMEEDADDADELAEMCVEAEVEPRFTALINDAGTALRDVAKAAAAVAGAADEMETNARGFVDAHQSEYRGVYEAVRASGVQQAKAGFYRKD